MLQLDPKGPVPLYYQLELMLREQIDSGQLRAGGPVPGEQDLAEQFGVSRITVRRALDRLEEDGLIERRRGARTLVASNIRPRAEAGSSSPDFRGFEDEMRRQGLQPTAKMLESTIGAPPPSTAALLEIPRGEDVVRIRRVGEAKGIPLWIESRYFPLHIGRALLGADLAGQSVLRLLDSTLGVRVGRVEARLEAVAANSRQAHLLRLELGSPLLLHESVTYETGMRPIQVLRSYLRGDCYKMVLHAAPVEDHSGLQLTGGGYLVGGGPLDG